MRYAARRDGNEGPLVKLAQSIGALMVREGPLDWWCWWRGNWTPVEIKLPEREGRASEFPPKQIQFRMRCKERNARWWVWRVESDVMRDLGARRSA